MARKGVCFDLAKDPNDALSTVCGKERCVMDTNDALTTVCSKGGCVTNLAARGKEGMTCEHV